MRTPTKFRHLVLILLAVLLWMPAAGRADLPVMTHALQVRLLPDDGLIEASDRLTLPDGKRQILFWLHEGMEPSVSTGDAILERIGHDRHLERFRLTAKGDRSVTLSYRGRIRHDMETVREGMGRTRMQSIGSISPDGVFLGGYSGWYPNVPGTLQRFALSVDLPPGWLAVSQGAGPDASDTPRGTRVRWREDNPQDEIQLSAARFKFYRQPTPFGEAQAYLRLPDDGLAQRYLGVTADYLARYSELIGPYPYAKFALVENFWETGYGMPSFTLLGSRVLRLPFILHSSYPHEILHNWWGNGVYVDYDAGNWSEGLTAYLADHLNQALDGRGADYRRDQLKAYADYVRDGADFPLIEFRGRHGSASQAIGYGKMLMSVHMLRRMLGDEQFKDGLRRFYADNLFRIADFDDMRTAFEAATGRDLTAFFSQWTRRTGAPALGLAEVRAEPAPDGGYRVSGRILQTQDEAPFPMTVPVVVHDIRGMPVEQMVGVDGRDTPFTVQTSSRPARVALDPAFDTFRKLMPGESPVALSNLFGAETGLIVLPADAPKPLLDGYRALANAWLQGHAGWRAATDAQLGDLPSEGPVWLLGWENRFLDALTASATAFSVDRQQRTVTIDGQVYNDVSAALTAEGDGRPLAWVAAAEADALPGLARKLPHYGKYGYLLFTGSAPENRLKGQWPAGDSALTHWLVDARPTLSPLQRPPLVTVDATEP
ncbi:MAG: M1 family peptidase [Thiohalocapsa sp.]|nr:M1 family peptidase [Thiohalocapsa sp.]MCF7991361.1 M1 family peptidase [Thiohalocapsa sp.]